MANFLNAVSVGNGRSAAGYQYAYAGRWTRKLIYLWLTKVVGWNSLETSGTRWDLPVNTGTDGATDTTNPRRFTSVSGGFTSADVGRQLVICPTAAPVTAGGFTDPERNGFHEIFAVYDGNTIDVLTHRCPHHDGLPLGETGLNWRVEDFANEATYIPRSPDYFVLRSQMSNGNYFDFKSRESTSNYSQYHFQVSPFADWVPGTPGDWSPGTRLIAESAVSPHYDSDRTLIWGYADQYKFIAHVSYYVDTWGTSHIPTFMYVGEFTPFHPAVDEHPVVQMITQTQIGTYLNFDPMDGVFRGLGYDDLTQATYYALRISYNSENNSQAHTGPKRTRSSLTGRYPLFPIPLACPTVGLNEIRGTLDDMWVFPDHGSPSHKHIESFGPNLEKLRIADIAIPWNGSRILQPMF